MTHRIPIFNFGAPGDEITLNENISLRRDPGTIDVSWYKIPYEWTLLIDKDVEASRERLYLAAFRLFKFKDVFFSRYVELDELRRLMPTRLETPEKYVLVEEEIPLFKSFFNAFLKVDFTKKQNVLFAIQKFMNSYDLRLGYDLLGPSDILWFPFLDPILDLVIAFEALVFKATDEDAKQRVPNLGFVLPIIISLMVGENDEQRILMRNLLTDVCTLRNDLAHANIKNLKEKADWLKYWQSSLFIGMLYQKVSVLTRSLHLLKGLFFGLALFRCVTIAFLLKFPVHPFDSSSDIPSRDSIAELSAILLGSILVGPEAIS